MTIDAFVDELTTIAPRYRWGTFHGLLIRARFPEEADNVESCCPITAVCEARSGRREDSDHAADSGRATLGMSVKDLCAIMDAADGRVGQHEDIPGHDPLLRERLLKAVGLDA